MTHYYCLVLSWIPIPEWLCCLRVPCLIMNAVVGKLPEDFSHIELSCLTREGRLRSSRGFGVSLLFQLNWTGSPVAFLVLTCGVQPNMVKYVLYLLTWDCKSPKNRHGEDTSANTGTQYLSYICVSQIKGYGKSRDLS